jgi:hypothetical protein
MFGATPAVVWSFRASRLLGLSSITTHLLFWGLVELSQSFTGLVKLCKLLGL